MNNNLKSRFILLYQMVLADGVVNIEEIKTLNRIGKEKYGISENQISEFIRDTNYSIQYPQTLKGKISLLYQLGEVAWADSQIDESEKKLIEKYILAMGFAEKNATDICQYILDQVKNKVPETDVIAQILNDN